jgi:hypothetical protein
MCTRESIETINVPVVLNGAVRSGFEGSISITRAILGGGGGGGLKTQEA